MYATRERKQFWHVKDRKKENTKLIERKYLIKRLYQPLEQQKGIREEQLNQVINEFPLIGQLYDVMNSFKETIVSRDANRLDKWIKEAQSIKSEDIAEFVNGITRDKEAVKNAIRYDYNNSLAEGSVNKLKVLKRIMYGRCSFDTLKKKLLLRENIGTINKLRKDPKKG